MKNPICASAYTPTLTMVEGGLVNFVFSVFCDGSQPTRQSHN